MHNYHSSVNSLPWGDGPWWIEWSAHTLLLPYMEQSPIYNAINFSDMAAFRPPLRCRINNPANTTATTAVISGFNCPSDPDRLTDPNGHNNYMANSGSAPNCALRRQCQYDRRGTDRRPDRSSTRRMAVDTGPPGFGGSSVNIAGITDGTSNTAAFSERVKAIGNNFTGTSAPFDGRQADCVALDTRPRSRNHRRGHSPQAYYQICNVTPPVPVNGNQDAANFNDDNISGAMWVSGQPALHALRSRHAAQHLELPFGTPDRPRGQQPSSGRRQRDVLRRIGQVHQVEHTVNLRPGGPSAAGRR